jgi:hypothetical protein
MARHRRRVVGLGAVALLAGCVGIGEQQFTFYVQNDLAGPTIVRFGSWGDILVEPGVNGRAATSFGTFSGPILVMDVSCRVLHTVEVTAQVGSLWLRADGTVRLAAVDFDAAPVQLPHTEQCAGATLLAARAFSSGQDPLTGRFARIYETRS